MFHSGSGNRIAGIFFAQKHYPDEFCFARMSKQYTNEQAEIAEKIKLINIELDKQNSNAMTADMFISTVRQYTRAKKLTERMLNELIERIEVHQTEKIDGVHVQRLTIYYRFVGTLEIPEIIEIPEITMQTRKGVQVTYSSTQKAG